MDTMNDLILYSVVLFLFLCISLFFYDALIPKTNFKVFKEKIFLKIAIFYLFTFQDSIGLSLLVIQILYSLYNRKKFQTWRKFDYCCVLIIAGILLLYLADRGSDKLSAIFSPVMIILGIFPFLLIASIFFTFKFSQRFYFYLKERKLRRALKKKTKEDLSNQEAQKEGYKQKNLEEKSNE